MFDRPPLLEEPFAQTLSGIKILWPGGGQKVQRPGATYKSVSLDSFPTQEFGLKSQIYFKKKQRGASQ